MDEATSALDYDTERQLCVNLQKWEGDRTVFFITHRLSTIRNSDLILVMDSGKIVEQAPVETIFASPSHPYTKGLINSLPKDIPNAKLETIPGAVPHPAFLPEGCAFHPRCPDKMDACSQEMPKLIPIDTERAQHLTACWLYDEVP